MSTTNASVLSIIAAFTSGIDVFKKLSKRRHKKPCKGANSQANEQNREELQLSRSLRRGPVDIQWKHERHVQGAGQLYAVGDSTAQACLAETLLKLNTGLVEIISAFLSSPRVDAHLDCKSLTNLSDASRVEAIDALDQLYHRVSRSDMALQRVKESPHHYASQAYSRKHGQQYDGRTVAVKGTEASSDTAATNQTRSRRFYSKASFSHDAGTIAFTIKKIPISASQKQLAIVRPRKRRSASASSSTASAHASSSSSTSQSITPTVLTTPCASPSALPELIASFPFPRQNAVVESERAVPEQASVPPHKLVPAAAGTSAAQRVHGPSTPAIPPKPLALRSPPTSSRLTHILRSPQPRTPQAPPPASAQTTTINPPPASLPPPLLPTRLPHASSSHPPRAPQAFPLARPRRPSVPTPSFHSFVSDSTKLGEIPMRDWAAGPWDFAAMERLNAEAKVSGWTPGMPVVREKPKSRLLAFLKRGK